MFDTTKAAPLRERCTLICPKDASGPAFLMIPVSEHEVEMVRSLMARECAVDVEWVMRPSAGREGGVSGEVRP